MMDRLTYVCWFMCAAILVSTSIARPQNATHADPWGMLDALPADIDIALVVENPAAHLLSESGKKSRSFLGSMGIFSRTRNAWGSLAGLFDTDSDGVIGTLMSGRVVFLMDSVFEHTDNPLTLMNYADTNWVVMVDADEESMNRLRQKLKPIPREIVSGIPVYAIEQGRYALVMLNNANTNTGRVMLSPKGGRDLLERALHSVMVGQSKNQNEPRPSPLWDAQDGWLLALRIRADIRIPAIEYATTTPRKEGSRHLRVMIGETDSGYHISAALPVDGTVPTGRAPVGLLGGLPEDVVVGVASSSVMRIVIDDHEGLSILLNDQEDRSGTTLRPEGSLMVLTAEDTRQLGRGESPMGVTVLSLFKENAVDASSMDALIEPLVMNGDSRDGLFPDLSSQPRSYNGMFPGAIRTQTVHDDSSGLGRVSWKTTKRGGSSDLIFSLGSTDMDTGQRVGMLDQVAGSLDAVGGAPITSSVVMSGFVRLGALLDSIPEWKLMGNLAGAMEGGAEQPGLVSWEVVHDPGSGSANDGVLRGSVTIDKR